MTVSEINIATVKQYARIDTDDDDVLIASIIVAAKEYCRSYTGLSIAELDGFPDMPIAVLAISADMYDLRQSSISGTMAPNPAVKQILASHSVNLI